MPELLKIILVDDHALFREGLFYTLQALGSSQIQIFEASTAAEAFYQIEKQEDIDLVLLDLDLPDMGGHEILPMLRSDYPDLPVVIISATQNPADVEKVIRNGASGYICKSTNSKNLLTALRRVLDGEVYMPDTSTFSIPKTPRPAARPQTEANTANNRLTPRQLEVLQLIGEGQSNKEIGKQLGMAEGTVKIHVTAILKELQANNRTQAVVLAKQSGLIVS